MQRHQQELSQAVEAADVQAALSVKKKGGAGKNSEPIGTRLTMTSRTGYFQDRIISPSMVRFMPPLTSLRSITLPDARHGHPLHRAPS